MRSVLNERNFIEIETPYLTRSTPEGARDFLVPARTQPGSFYALPQSPQLFKQLLMMGGFERYYQIARCFRDEDTRADRQPEFTQLDLEMSFVEEDDVIETMEAVMGAVFAAAGFERSGAAVATDAVRRGAGAVRRRSPRHPLRPRVARPGAGGGRDRVRGVRRSAERRRGGARDQRRGPRTAALGARWTDRVGQAPRREGTRVGVRAAGRHAALADREVPQRGGGRADHCASGGRQRRPAADRRRRREHRSRRAQRAAPRARPPLRAVPQGRHDILWVVDFPAFFWDAEAGRWDAAHHPFTAPAGDLADPGSLSSRAYDLVLDGAEIGGGSIRIHQREVQERVFELLGIAPEEAQARFGFLLDALRYGAPPHGGIAMGIDRIAAALAGAESIRDVIAFPKAASGADPLTGAPAPVDPAQLRELGLRRA